MSSKAHDQGEQEPQTFLAACSSKRRPHAEEASGAKESQGDSNEVTAEQEERIDRKRAEWLSMFNITVKSKRSISERLEDGDALVFRGLDQLHPCFAREGFTVAIPEQRTLSLCQQDSLIPSGVFSSEGHRHWEAG